ncbi:MAG: quinone-dependent dihydroorotate dehydrogenase [Paracoccaceae bacterium]
MKRLLQFLALPVLQRMDAEKAHRLAIRALRAGLVPAPGPISSKRLVTTVGGLRLPNPVGLAAGFDKNAEAVGPLLQAGFGFIEVGAVTPRPQPGNPPPRLFRLRRERAVINRFGFNNEGMEVIADRLAESPSHGAVGVNLGANSQSLDRAADYATVLKVIGPFVDFATVNVSSPNTEDLHELQAKDALSALVDMVMEAREGLPRSIPVFVKISPDLDDRELADVAHVALTSGITGLIATNTTLSRAGLKSPLKSEVGGLSGQPLFDRSTRVLARLYDLTGGEVPLIGVGGVATPQQAYAKITAGASAIQLYTAMVYGGIGIAADIAKGLHTLIGRDGFDTVAEAVGSKMSDWL